MRKSLLAAIAVAGSMLLQTPAHAGYIVNTGSDPQGNPWDFNISQYFAGQFSIGQNDLVTGVEGYFGNEQGHSGRITAEIFSNSGNAPGSVLFSETFILPHQSAVNWYGVSGVDWDLAAGTYWLAFAPDANIDGSWQGGAPLPLADYKQADNGVWDFRDYRGLAVGERISGAPAAVPEPTSLALLGAGLLGLFVVRRLLIAKK